MKYLVIVLVLLCLLIGAQGGETDLNQLVLQLGSVSFKERENADAALRALEKDVVPILARHTKAPDPEVQQRVVAIIAYLKTKPLTLRFADTNLVTAIKEAHGLDVLTDQSVKRVTSLKLRDRGITNLMGIAQLQDLSSLDLEGNGISDISELSKLLKVRYLKLQYNSITNIAPLLENMKRRDPGVSLTLYLTGNPLRRETSEKQIEKLRLGGVSIHHLWKDPLPEDWEVRFSKPVLRPYERMHIYVIPKPAEDARAAYEKHGMLRVDDGAGTVQKEGEEEPTPLKSLYVNWSGGRKWLLFTRTSKFDESIRQRKPGTYTYNLVVRGKETLWICPPIKLRVEVPEEDREMFEEFEQTKASAFLQHAKGYRSIDEADEQAVPYDRLIAFLRKHQDTYLSSLIAGRARDLSREDINYDRRMNASDKKAIAAIGVLSGERFVQQIEAMLMKATEDLEKVKGDPKARASSLRKAEEELFRAKEWSTYIED
jgi:hypothetical protein